MMNIRNGQHKALLVPVVLTLALFAGTNAARAAYTYDFHFDALNSQWGDFPADDFSFVSPALIGPDASMIPGSPYIHQVTFAPPAELNGFSFDTVIVNGYSFSAPLTLANLDGIDFAPAFTEWDSGVPIGSVGAFAAQVSFPAGAYGPGTYTSDWFQRYIQTTQGGLVPENSTGRLTITSVPMCPVPAPGALLLGSIGVGAVSWLRKRRTL